MNQQYRNVLLLAISQALYLIAVITVLTLSAIVGQQLTPEPSLATLPVAAAMIGAVISTLPASLLMKRIGRRAGFIVGTLGGGFAGGIVATAGIMVSSFWLFCLGNLLIGLYQAFGMYYRFAAADAASPAFRSRAISLVLAGGVAAAFLGPWNASYSQILGTPPESGPYIVLAVLAVVATLLVSLLRIPAVNEPHGPAQRPLTRVMVQPRFQIAVVAAAVGYAIMILVMTATPIAMQGSGFDISHAAFVMQWHTLGMFVPSFFTGHLIARLGLRRMLVAGVLIQFLSVGVAVSGEALWQYWVALVFLGVGWNFLFVGGSTLLTETHTPEERGKVQGVNDLAVFSLVALGSLLAGTFLHHVGWIGLNLVALPFLALTLVMVLRLPKDTAPATRVTGRA